MNVFGAICALILFGFLAWSISFDSWVKCQTERTYVKYPELKNLNFEINDYGRLISETIGFIKNYKKQIDQIYENFLYHGETEEEANKLKELQRQVHCLEYKLSRLINAQKDFREKRDQFITSHSIRYY